MQFCQGTISRSCLHYISEHESSFNLNLSEEGHHRVHVFNDHFQERYLFLDVIVMAESNFWKFVASYLFLCIN